MRGRNSNKAKSGIIFVICVLLIGAAAYICSYGLQLGDYRVKPIMSTINRGLDLQGGISVLEEIQADSVDNKTLERTIELLSMRVNKMGVSETTVTKEGNKRIRIDIPGKFDVKEVTDTIGKTGELKFVGPDNQVILTGKDVKDATPGYDQNNKIVVNLELNDAGTKKFADATQKFIGQQIAIYMDEEMLTNPTVNDVITGGRAQISGSKSMEEAKRQASIIKSGALPVTVKTASVKTVGPTLGANAIPNSLLAAGVGIGLVFFFMLVLYRVPGLMANIGLVLYVVLVLGVFSTIQATLTLSGIAAFLLNVGIAVDANVLMFERIKEELKTGKSVKSSFEAGYKKALSSILDSNITTMIAGIVLYSFGTGAVKGFALILIVGILVGLFTGIVVTRFLLKMVIDAGWVNKPIYFGVKGGQEHA